jgi:hypothetical protein
LHTTIPFRYNILFTHEGIKYKGFEVFKLNKLLSTLLLKLKEEVQWFIVKRHNGSNSYLFGILYKQKSVMEGSVSCGLHQKIKSKQSPRKKVEDTYEVRVEGRSKEGLISFAN